MIPYYLTAVLAVALAFAAERFRPAVAAPPQSGGLDRTPARNHVRSSVLYWTLAGAALLLLVAFSAFRVDIGTDYPLYETIYGHLDTGSWWPQILASPHEPGFTALSLATRLITESPRLLFALAAILTVVPTFFALRERSAAFPLAICLYLLLGFYVLPFNIVRQGIAIALNLYSLRFLDNRRWLFVALNLLAGSFHFTALVAAAIQYPARNWRPSKRFFLLVLLAATAALAATQLPITEELFGAINPRYGQYLAEARASFGAVGLGTLGVLVFRIATIAYSRWLPTSRDLERYQTFLMIGLFFVIVGMVVNPLSRIEFYFSICAVILLPNQLKAKGARWPEICAVLAFSLVYFAVTLVYFNGLLPYTSFLL